MTKNEFTPEAIESRIRSIDPATVKLRRPIEAQVGRRYILAIVGGVVRERIDITDCPWCSMYEDAVCGVHGNLVEKARREFRAQDLQRGAKP